MANAYYQQYELHVEGAIRPCSVYFPPDYTPTRTWPLVVFLHGKGERGDDGRAVRTVGLGPALERYPARYPALVLLPQCPADCYWVDTLHTVDAALGFARASLPIDPQRIYLTGISMGGFGTWHYAAQQSSTFAALMPICGGGNPEHAACLASTPIWAFHGAKDPVIPVERSRDMVQAVQALTTNVRYTEYADEAHDCWDRAYSDQAVAQWLFAQRRVEAV